MCVLHGVARQHWHWRVQAQGFAENLGWEWGQHTETNMTTAKEVAAGKPQYHVQILQVLKILEFGLAIGINGVNLSLCLCIAHCK